jgi:hypothetical protein
MVHDCTFLPLDIPKECQPHEYMIQDLQVMSGRQGAVALAQKDWSFERT